MFFSRRAAFTDEDLRAAGKKAFAEWADKSNAAHKAYQISREAQAREQAMLEELRNLRTQVAALTQENAILRERLQKT